MIFIIIPYSRATGSNRASLTYSSQWLHQDIDRNYVLWACNDIYALFLGENSLAEYYYDHVENRSAQAYWSLMSEKITHCENYHTFATVLYLGHGGILNMGNYYRLSVYEQASHNNPNTPPPAIYDYMIYDRTLNGKHRFTFLWACFQGNLSGSNAPAVHGMAYCWTKQPNLSGDGYGDPNLSGDPDTRPYCFIGFELASPRLSEPIKNNTGNLYKHWLVFFYYHALNGYSINQALDRASQNVGYERWLDNPLRNGFRTYFPPEFLPPGIPLSPDNTYLGRMRIYGNGNINLLWG
ncbi:MAG: hypothetical protein QW744_06900 [Candidatus Bathyarchaeia archaeon]